MPRDEEVYQIVKRFDHHWGLNGDDIPKPLRKLWKSLGLTYEQDDNGRGYNGILKLHGVRVYEVGFYPGVYVPVYFVDGNWVKDIEMLVTLLDELDE